MSIESMVVTLSPGVARRIREEAGNTVQSTNEMIEQLILEALRARSVGGN